MRFGVSAVVVLCLGVPSFAHAQDESRLPDAPADPGTPLTELPLTEPPPSEPTIATLPAVPSPGAPIADSPRPAAEPFAIQPFGYLRLQYKIVRNDPNVQFVGRDDGFELQNARFGVQGTLKDLVAYKFSLEGAVDERTQVNVPDGKLRVALRDAYGDIAVGGGGIAVRAGYFKTLVDPDLDDDTFREFIDQPLATRGVRATQGFQTDGLTPGRSLGAALRLDPAPPETGVKLGFEVAVQNGADEYASDNDNDTPAVSASGLVRLPRGGYVVASGRFNRRTEGQLPLRRDEDDLQGSLGARFAVGPAAISGGGFVQRTLYPTTDGPVRNAYGAHAALVFTFATPAPIGVGYRFTLLDPSSLILTDRLMEHSLGAVMAIPSYRMRVQLQLTHAAEQAARKLTNDRIQLAAELAL